MIFNKIGKTYNNTRSADKRIMSELIRLLGLQKGSIIADIGAGTGNYSFALANAGYTNLTPQIIPFELPSDLTDNFAAAAWKRPQLYLNQDYRSNISSFRMTDSDIVDSSVKQLSSDLKCGRWEKLYGDVLHIDKIDAGYYFIFAK